MPVSRSLSAPPWLLLMFSLPARRASQRVEVWRKLKRYGALPLRTSGYLLPNSPANREHFEWLAAVIRKYKGEASVAQLESLDDLPSERLVQMFREARGREYQALIRELNKLLGRSRRPAGQLTRLRRRLQEIIAIDFFNSPLRSRAETLLARADTEVPPPIARAPSRKSRKDFLGRVWVTRPRPGIDRVSSAWLIRRFIDRKARFVFDQDARQHWHAVAFDMFHGGGFAHRGEDCTFETLRKEFSIRDPRVAVLAQIVHDADLGDEKFGRPEGAGLDRALVGWAQQGVSDEELLRRGMELIEGLYHALA